MTHDWQFQSNPSLVLGIYLQDTTMLCTTINIFPTLWSMDLMQMVIRLCIQETYILVNYFKIISELTLALHFEMRSKKPLLSKLDFKGCVPNLLEII